MRTKKIRQDDKLNTDKTIKKLSKMIVGFALVQACILIMISYAWFSFLSGRKVFSEEREVMPPYYLYLVDANGSDRLRLSVGNLHPGETKQIVIGVSNQNPDGESGITYNIGNNSSFQYELELAHTNNLPLTYQVYSLEEPGKSTTEDQKVTVEWTDTESRPVSKEFEKKLLGMNSNSESISKKNNTEMYGDKVDSTVNLATYNIYDNSTGTDFTLKTTVDNGSVTFDLDYYMIELKWAEDISFSDYLKETDLIYVIVNAMQLEPQEATEVTTD